MRLLSTNISTRPRHNIHAGRQIPAIATVLLLALSLPARHVLAAPEIITDVFNPMSGHNQFSFPSISGDGRYIAFRHIENNKTNINVYDRIAGISQQIDLTPNGLPSAGGAESPMMSADGRFVVYSSRAPDMGVPKGGGAYFVYDRINKTTETVVTGTGSQIFGQTYAAISADGRFIAYRIESNPSSNSTIFVRDMVSKTTQVTNATTTFINGSTDRMSISDNGRYISYRGKASKDDKRVDLLLHDRVAGTTELLNINTAGEREILPGGSVYHSMSSDGNVIVFASASKNLSPSDLGTNMDVFVRDRKAGTTERISGLATNPVNYGDSGNFGPSVSSDGRFVSYFGFGKASTSPGLYLYDRATKTGRRAPPSNNTLLRYPILSASGRYVVYDLFNASDYAHSIGTTDFGAVSGLTLSSKTLALTEGGAAATYTAVLDQEPSADVQVGVAPDAQLSVARPQLTFTPANWATPQTVSVQAVADGVVEGRHSGTVLHTVNSADPAYTVVPAARVTVAITDTVVPTIDAPATWGQPDLPVHGTAAPGATVLLSAVNLAGGGVTAVSVVADARGAWSWTLPGLAEGKYELQAEADGVKSLVRPVELVFAKPALDITASVTTYSSGLSFNRATQQFSGTFSVTNATGAALKGPFQVQFDALPAGITLLNASGSHNGSPYVTVKDAALAPGASFTFPVLYLNPAKLGLPYTNKIYSGKF